MRRCVQGAAGQDAASGMPTGGGSTQRFVRQPPKQSPEASPSQQPLSESLSESDSGAEMGEMGDPESPGWLPDASSPGGWGARLGRLSGGGAPSVMNTHPLWIHVLDAQIPCHGSRF